MIQGTGLSSIVRRGTSLVLDALLPHRCLSCGTLVEAAGVLCPECWLGIEMLGPPQCDACGLPFEYDMGEGTVCGACARERPPFERARAALLYNERSRDLVLAFKHADRTEGAATFARWMIRAGEDLVAGADIVVPVPLHWSRLFARRYNQAALLAQAIGREAGIEAGVDVLVRRRRTPSQGRLGRSARRRNVTGAFAVPPRRRSVIADRRVLLVDDVMTTGATVAACAKVLLRAGAASVDVLTMARVVRAA